MSAVLSLLQRSVAGRLPLVGPTMGQSQYKNILPWCAVLASVFSFFFSLDKCFFVIMFS